MEAGWSARAAGAAGTTPVRWGDVGDLMAVDPQRERLRADLDENPFAAGPYATGQKTRGIRNYAGNFPATGAFPARSLYSQINPLNFSDIGYDLTGPEVTLTARSGRRPTSTSARR